MITGHACPKKIGCFRWGPHCAPKQFVCFTDIRRYEIALWHDIKQSYFTLWWHSSLSNKTCPNCIYGAKKTCTRGTSQQPQVSCHLMSNEFRHGVAFSRKKMGHLDNHQLFSRYLLRLGTLLRVNVLRLFIPFKNTRNRKDSLLFVASSSL